MLTFLSSTSIVILSFNHLWCEILCTQFLCILMQTNPLLSHRLQAHNKIVLGHRIMGVTHNKRKRAYVISGKHYQAYIKTSHAGMSTFIRSLASHSAKQFTPHSPNRQKICVFQPKNKTEQLQKGIIIILANGLGNRILNSWFCQRNLAEEW